MATIRPFKGFRPTPELCSKVAALPYDVMTSKEAREMVKNDPYSFLHVLWSRQSDFPAPAGPQQRFCLPFRTFRPDLVRYFPAYFYTHRHRSQWRCTFHYRSCRQIHIPYPAGRTDAGLHLCFHTPYVCHSHPARHPGQYSISTIHSSCHRIFHYFLFLCC